jgi:hypothetical protein
MRYTRHGVGAMRAPVVGIGTHFNSTLSPWAADGLLRAGFSDAEIGAIKDGKYLSVQRSCCPHEEFWSAQAE